MYLKISLEDASPSCLWSQHLWGAVEASTLSFHLILAAGKGQGQRGFELGSPTHVSLLAQSCFGRRLSPYSGYCYSLPSWLVCHARSVIGVSGDSPLPFLPYLCPIFTDKKYTQRKRHLKSFLKDFQPKYTSTKQSWKPFQLLQLEMLHLCRMHVYPYLNFLFVCFVSVLIQQLKKKVFCLQFIIILVFWKPFSHCWLGDFQAGIEPDAPLRKWGVIKD